MTKLEVMKTVSVSEVSITNSVENSVVHATVRHSGDNIVAIENGVIMVDDVHIGNFMVGEGSKPTIHNIDNNKLNIIGSIVSEAITKIETEFE